MTNKILYNRNSVIFIQVLIPQWGYNSALQNALEYQLTNFWNKDIAEDQK